MKKILCTLLVLSLVFCSAAFAQIDLTGEWYANVYGVPVTLQVNGDGTVSMFLGEDGEDGSWVEEDGKFIINKGLEDETVLLIDEENNQLTDETQTMVFGREPIEAIALPARVTADDIAAFDGTWELSILSAYGMTIDAVQAQDSLGDLFGEGATSQLIIANGTANIFGTDEQEFPFVDGKLYIASPDEEDEEGLYAQTIALCEDGSICYTLLGMEFYFTAAAE